MAMARIRIAQMLLTEVGRKTRTMVMRDFPKPPGN
jgi:hypothetical protein